MTTNAAASLSPMHFVDGADFLERHGEILRAREGLDQAFAAGCCQALAKAFEDNPWAIAFQLAPPGSELAIRLWLSLDGATEVLLSDVFKAVRFQGRATMELESRLGPGNPTKAYGAFRQPMEMMLRDAPRLFDAASRVDARIERGGAVSIARTLSLHGVAAFLEAGALEASAGEPSAAAPGKRAAL